MNFIFPKKIFPGLFCLPVNEGGSVGMCRVAGNIPYTGRNKRTCAQEIGVKKVERADAAAARLGSRPARSDTYFDTLS